MDYEKYEKQVEKNRKENEKYLSVFDNWLEEKNLSPKTVEGHLGNVEFYLNDFLNYYEPTKMQDGWLEIDSYLGDWFIRKCMWSTESTVKSNAASIKKFYECMSECNYISNDTYQKLCEIIKKKKKEWVDAVNRFNNADDMWF